MERTIQGLAVSGLCLFAGCAGVKDLGNGASVVNPGLESPFAASVTVVPLKTTIVNGECTFVTDPITGEFECRPASETKGKMVRTTAETGFRGDSPASSIPRFIEIVKK